MRILPLSYPDTLDSISLRAFRCAIPSLSNDHVFLLQCSFRPILVFVQSAAGEQTKHCYSCEVVLTVFIQLNPYLHRFGRFYSIMQQREKLLIQLSAKKSRSNPVWQLSPVRDGFSILVYFSILVSFSSILHTNCRSFYVKAMEALIHD